MVTATYHPSRKLSKLNKPDMQSNAGEVMYSCGPFHMDEQKQDDQLEPTYSSSVPIQDIALKICREQLTIETGSERKSEISALMIWHDDDDDDEIATPAYTYEFVGTASLTSKPTRMSSSLIECPIHSAWFNIEAKSLVNYYTYGFVSF